jgi:exportin-2 (importin alpha re-exporter)
MSAEQQQLASILNQTLSPDATLRRAAERELTAAQAHPSFGPTILALAQDSQQGKPTRQSAALSFKNWIKANWAVSCRSILELRDEGGRLLEALWAFSAVVTPLELRTDPALPPAQLEDAPTPLTTSTAEALKQSVVSIMITLSGAPALQVQIGEAIAIMAEADFPDRWDNLVDVRFRPFPAFRGDIEC